MRNKFFAVSALTSAMLMGCSAMEPATEMVAETKAKVMKKMEKKPEPPKLIMGASAKMLADTCEGCHGTNGVSNGPASPTIAGMSEDYLNETMLEFKDGEYQSTIMGRIANGFSNEEIESMAVYFSQKQFKSAAQSADTSLAKKGKMLHEEYCEKCHKEGGSDVSDDTGLLAGQWIPYLTYTLEDFRTGKRTISTKKMQLRMDEMLEKEGENGVTALIQYYGSQK